MSSSLRELLNSKKFWGWLACANFIGLCLGLQPLAGLASVLALGAGYLLLGLSALAASGRFWALSGRAAKGLIYLIVFLLPALALLYGFGYLGFSETSDTSIGLALGLNTAGWIAGYVFYRRNLAAQGHAAADQQRRGEERKMRDSTVREEASRTTRQRRDRARARCEAFFLRHAPELQGRFAREQLDDFMRRYMHDELGADEVEAREAELVAMMEHHLEFGGRKKKKPGLTDLIEWFNDEKRKIEGMDLAPDDEEQILRNLEERFGRLQESHIRTMQP